MFFIFRLIWTIIRYSWNIVNYGFMALVCIVISSFAALYVYSRYMSKSSNAPSFKDLQSFTMETIENLELDKEQGEKEIEKKKEQMLQKLLDKKKALPLVRVITAVKQTQIKKLNRLLDSICEFQEPSEVEIIVWDLGLLEEDRKTIEDTYSIKLIPFDSGKYPSHIMNTSVAGEYAWKPAVIKETVDMYGKGYYIWLDPGNTIVMNMTLVIQYILKYNIFSPDTSIPIHSWTHPSIFKRFDPVFEKYKRNTIRDTSVIGFYTGEPWVNNFIKVWSEISEVPDILVPEGSTFQNHRQEQSIFSLLYWNERAIHKFDTISNFKTLFQMDKIKEFD